MYLLYVYLLDLPMVTAGQGNPATGVPADLAVDGSGVARNERVELRGATLDVQIANTHKS